MTEIYDVLIAGGGIIGLSTAIAMQQRGYSVALFDSGSLKKDTNTTRVYAINEASRQLFQQLGIWQSMDKARFSPYSDMQVWDAKSGAAIHFEARLVAATQLGFILEESLIRNALLDKISTYQGIQLFPETPVTAVQEQPGLIQVSSHAHHWQGKLLMVTDGAQSPTRELLQVSLTSWPYHQQALVATIQTELSHQQTAWQVFHPEGPLALLPLADSRFCSIVWTNSAEKTQDLIHADEQTFNQALEQAFGTRLGHLTLAGKRQSFPLMMRHAKKYTGAHWILLGDAAHTIHPLAGLGLNLGLADIATWLSCLPAGQSLAPPARILGMYQRKRKYDTWQAIALMEGLKQVFGSTHKPAIFLRSLGLRACDTIVPLKRFLASQAMGTEDVFE